MPRKLGTIIATRELRDAGSDRTLEVQIGSPRRSGRVWECPFRIKGLGRVQVACGVDALQALLMAVEGIRVEIASSGKELSFLEEGDGGVPRYVPGWYGPTLSQRIGSLIDRELRKFERGIAGKRASKRPSRPAR